MLRAAPLIRSARLAPAPPLCHHVRVTNAPGTPATAALAAAGIPFVPHSYDHDPGHSSFGLEAAEVLRVDPGQVFKTLVAEVDGGLAVAIVPVNGRLDLKAFAAALGARKAELADPKLAERRTGYVVGGISPIGQKLAHPTVLDETAELYDTVYVSGGRRGFDIELAPADLVRVTSAVVAAIRRD